MASRKIYRAVAQAINEARTAPATVNPVPEVQVACDHIAEALVPVFKDDNPLFDRHRFLVVAGAKAD